MEKKQLQCVRRKIGIGIVLAFIFIGLMHTIGYASDKDDETISDAKITDGRYEGVTKGDGLVGLDRAVYDLLVEKFIRKKATVPIQEAGGLLKYRTLYLPEEAYVELTTTAKELGVETLSTDKLRPAGCLTPEAIAAADEFYTVHYNQIRKALFYDYPEFAWETIWIASFPALYRVYQDDSGQEWLGFQSGSHWEIDIGYSMHPECGTVIREILQNARNLSDYDKLRYYAQAITGLTQYDGHFKNITNGSEWSVFDYYMNDGNRAETPTVCDGYSRAYQLLGSLTDFQDPDLQVFYVTGDLIALNLWTGERSGELHAWNHVRFGNGEIYGVDVTNLHYCYPGSVAIQFPTYDVWKQSGIIDELVSSNFLFGADSIANRDLELWEEYPQSLQINGQQTNYRPPETPHVHQYVQTKITTPDCDHPGFTWYTCTGCGATIRKNRVEATGHHYALAHQQEATCVRGAYDVYRCTECGKEKAIDTSEPLGHTRKWSREVTETDVTDSEYCPRCGMIYTQTVTKRQEIGKDLRMEADLGDEVYTGEEIRKELLWRENSDVLTSAEAITNVTYMNNTNVGTATIHIEGRNYTKGSADYTFRIVPKSIEDMTAAIDWLAVEAKQPHLIGDVYAKSPYLYYTGEPLNPLVTCSWFDGMRWRILQEGRDFTVEYQDNILPGTGKAVIKGTGNYTGTIQIGFEIKPYYLGFLAPEGKMESYDYTGKEICPKPVLKVLGKTLQEGRDYTLSYANNVEIGIGTVYFTGMGNYSGTGKANFNIFSYPLEKVEVSGVEAVYEGTGTSVHPKPILRHGDRILEEGADYRLSYEGGWHGASVIKVTQGDRSRYVGELKIPYEIVGHRQIREADIRGLEETVVATGQQIRPAVTVYDRLLYNAERELYDFYRMEEGKDYQISYGENTKPGEGSVTLTGIGAYTGSVTKTFRILSEEENRMQVSGVADSYEYSGYSTRPNITVQKGGRVLSATEYKVTYGENINAGEGSVTVTGTGANAGESVTKTFRILPKPIPGNYGIKVNTTMDLFFWNGGECRPNVQIRTLVEGRDYLVSYADNIRPGTGTVTIQGIGNYTGTYTEEFEIGPRSISNASLELSKEIYEYTGAEIVPELRVLDGENVLKEGTDYDVTLTANRNAGYGDVTVTGKGDYSGSIRKRFRIQQKNIQDAHLEGVEAAYVYTGDSIQPAVTLRIGDRVLTEGTDYTVTYGQNWKQSGTVTITGQYNYTGEIKKTFRILPKGVADWNVTAQAETLTYTGAQQTLQNLTVKDGTRLLYEGSQYTVTYENNREVGTAVAVITACGEYTGVVRKEFTIQPKDLSAGYVTGIAESYPYTGQAICPSVSRIRGLGSLEPAAADYTVTYEENTEVGTAAVVISGCGNFTGTIRQEFQIAAKDITQCKFEGMQSSYTYTGDWIVPILTIKDGDYALKQGTDYEIRMQKSVDAGAWSIGIVGTGHYTGVKALNFWIMEKSAKELTVEGLQAEYPYTGEPICPAVTVKDGTKTLTEGIDYQLQYLRNEAAGIGTLQVTGCGNYTGTQTQSFRIVEKETGVWEVTGVNASYPYTGQAICPDVKVRDGDVELRPGTDYKVIYGANKNAGEGSVQIEGLGNYKGTVTKTFRIEPKSLNGAAISGLQESYTWTGAEIRPMITVNEGTRTLKSGSDYTLEWKDNQAVGTAQVTVKGTGNYAGAVSQTFRITAKSMDFLTVTGIPQTKTYTGSAIRPVVTVYDGQTTLREDTDYTVSYGENTNAGEGSVVLEGKGGYAGTKTWTFQIEAKAIRGTTISGLNESYAWTGEAICPIVTVQDGAATLGYGTDYTLEWEYNQAVGTAQVTIRGCGNYTGYIVKLFQIAAKSMDALTIEGIPQSEIYTGSAIKPTVKVLDGKTVLTEGVDYTVSYGTNTEVGEGSVVIKGKGGYGGTRTLTFQIEAKPISTVTISGLKDSCTWTGTQICPNITVQDGAKNLASGTDYTVSYGNNTNAGEGKITVTGTGHYAGTKELTFRILPKEIQACTVSGLEATYPWTGTKVQPQFTVTDGTNTLKAGTDYETEWKDQIDPGTAVVTIKGKGNYTGSTQLAFRIVKPDAEPEVSVTPADYTAVDAAMARIPSDLTRYTESSVALLKQATAQVVRNYTSERQAEVDAMAKAIEEAVNGLTAQVVHVTELRMNETNLSLTLGESVQLTVQVLPEHADDPAVTWSSSDASVATVDANGRVTAKKAGTARITATANDGAKTAGCEITVTEQTQEQKPAEYASVDAAIAKVPADRSIYTEDSVARLQTALAAVDRNLTDKEQQKVDAMAKAIEDALAALEERPADETALNAAMEKARSLNQVEYTEESVAAVQAAAARYVTGLPISRQTEVDAIAKAIEDAIAALVPKAKPNGLYNIDGAWKYYENGVFAAKTGMVQRPDTKKWFYVDNGVYNNKATGVVQRVDNKKYYYIKNGRYDNTFTGVATDLSKKNTYYITKGQVKAVTGVFKDGKKWKYFVNGKFSASTGVVARSSDKKWVYISKGVVTASTGLAKRLTDNKWLYVEKGVLAKKTGLVQRISDKKWFFVQNGVFNNKYTGGAKKISDGKWIYVEKGRPKNATGLAKCTDKKYRYFKSGKFFKYTGKAKLISGGTKQYPVQQGIKR